LIDPIGATLVPLELDLVDAATFVTGRSLDGPAEYHGTFVAGILAASANNSTDVAGVAYHSQIMPIAVVDGSGSVTAFDLAAGISHAIDRGARVINMSLGMEGPAHAVEAAIQRASQSQVLMAAAAGNNANDAPFYPAFYSGVMSVTASTIADRPGSCTNYSAKTSVAAPGAGVIGLDPRANGGLSIVACGTSTATPHVSGLAALLMAQHPGRTVADIRRIIEATADDDSLRPGRDEYFGAGRINVERALRFLDHTPEVSKVTVGIPPSTGGPVQVTATASTESASVITAAEMFIGRLGAPGTGVPLSAVDGSFNQSSEFLKGTLQTTLQQPAGAHRIWVRAKNAAGWGPASTSALLIDRTAPQVQLRSPEPLVAVSAAGLGASISVLAKDDFGINGKLKYEVKSAVTGQFVASSPFKTFKFGEEVQLVWSPSIGTAGIYELTVSVLDEAGNTGKASARVLVV
jgi:hypothetical protein